MIELPPSSAGPSRAAGPCALLAAMVLVAALPARADTADTLLIRIERPEAAYADMGNLPTEVARFVVRLRSREGVPDDPLPSVPANAFDAAKALAAQRTALAGTGAAEAPAGLSAAADRLAAAEAALEKLSPERIEAEGPDMEARYAARPDKAAIERLAPLTAAAGIASEQTLAGKRIEWAIRTALVEREPLRRAGEAGIATIVEDSLRATREASPEDDEPPFQRGPAAQTATLRREMALAQLAPEDVAALLAFYESDGGRAKRDALVAAFAASSDKDGRAAMTEILRAAKGAPGG
ncbi:hypothetical protein [Aureimonas leprariae]|uniref:DUF2059 domain-containing protein n=1 Tax=Plantimonas leprariae TaxID=2615207 RepID=A0A7V7TWQ2_9HYPH|nr:hypothetical protein [Aureimonas leprariae]KAB0680248.1 hypothetical protein F6X38_08690 [Aureimonas leprariae]